MRYFFSHLIEIDSLIIELDKMDLSKEQKLHLTSLIDSSLYHTILDAILSELTPQDKKMFLSHLKKDDKERIWEFLNGKIDNIEERIKKVGNDLKNELHKDLKEVSKNE